ncbi:MULTISPECIES: cortex morphogenetic protein CmpA [Gracilibacillus]|uniref:Cortex morphogenetic protein CmpA n=1 Tax=Gracilibacillus dipsosauri TaxID=178340 RepID=A0A317KXM4_9BACI|nr:cortex morphogenetic protein CmpA [Gracilibacillus dipsosauri]PWU68076.1 cortex morphogenetic protein CmpA [Gracilibacillus dipsosauri]
MPTWLKKQLTGAFLQKDKYQIRLLNQCWFFYCTREND